MSKSKVKQQELFETKFVPGKPGSGMLFEEEFVGDDVSVECQGMTFENDVKRREYFLGKLQEKLKDPEFRKIEGFPIGEDEDILGLSDPPYYTACPNPFIEDFIKYYGDPYDPASDVYRKEPLAADSTFGKTSNAITRAHPYHTKVPPEAVQEFATNYLQGKGGILLDCFCGIGMSGIGLNLYREREKVESAAILCDLSTIASFAAYNYLNVSPKRRKSV